MRFLADESFDFRLVRAMRAAGHDVAAVVERIAGAPDVDVMRLASDEDRILLTEDKDFGWLVHVSGEASRGVVLVRCPERERIGLAEKLVHLVATQGRDLTGAFVVVNAERARFSRLPGASAP